MARKGAKTPVSSSSANEQPQRTNGGAHTAQPADAELQKKLSELRTHLREAIGNIIIGMMALPRYREQTLGDLQHLVVEPMVNDRIAMAYSGQEQDQTKNLAGIAIWASVSEEVDASIRRQIREGVFPVRLKASDWNSGTINWLFDVIAADQTMAARVLANFRQLVKEGGLRLHPLIARLVDPETLKKMGAEKAGQG